MKLTERLNNIKKTNSKFENFSTKPSGDMSNNDWKEILNNLKKEENKNEGIKTNTPSVKLLK